jgi:[NiFe] hydrogenase diaphorase moiety large subunit
MPPENFSNIKQQVASLCETHDCEPHRLLQILIQVQEIYCFIPPEAITSIARHLNLPRVTVEGAAGFYSFLSLELTGDYRVLFSDNVTDQMLGNQELMRQFCTKLWLEPGKVL